MDRKVKFVITMALGIMLAISLFNGLATYNAKRALEVEFSSLKVENGNLSKKLNDIARDRKLLEERVTVLNNDLEKSSRETQDLRTRYDSAVKERDELIEKAKTLQKNYDKLRADLANVTREKQKLGQKMEEGLNPLKNENVKLKQELANVNKIKSGLDAELSKLKGEKSGLEQKLSRIDSVLQEKLTNLRYLSIKEELDAIGAGTQAGQAPSEPQAQKESVELPPIIVKPQTPAQPFETSSSASARPAGSVLEINKANKFVIVDLGRDSGVKTGDTFRVFRHGSPIAIIEVIQARQGISACDIKEESLPVETGDIVR
ncbi:MAG: hypothetical protein PHE18_01685 [Candidatus Omnitrophica bacterium]|nr:hypothetical protein [Candidatus Omnitrophota bacterium]MDD5552566.1 hypothetical protein [Candidatus Omnitrophota bacterium]